MKFYLCKYIPPRTDFLATMTAEEGKWMKQHGDFLNNLLDKGLIVAVKTTDRRNDQGLARPLVDEVARRYGRVPKRALFDEGYAARTDVDHAASR